MSAMTVPTWADIRAGWSASWKALAAQATATWQAAVQANPGAFLPQATAFTEALAQSRASLDRLAAALPQPPVTEADRQAVLQHQALERRYHELAAGFYADAVPAPAGASPLPVLPSTGAAPVLILGGLAVGAVGVAWAIAATQYAVNLREQTALAERELDARIAAGNQGRTLQPSTLPPQADPVDAAAGAAKGLGLLFVGGLVVATGAFILPALLRK